jgi:hypothetical protein
MKAELGYKTVLSVFYLERRIKFVKERTFHCEDKNSSDNIEHSLFYKYYIDHRTIKNFFFNFSFALNFFCCCRLLTWDAITAPAAHLAASHASLMTPV